VLEMLKRHEIQVLRRAGHTQADTAELAGVSERTVRTVEREIPVAASDDAAERERRGIGRPSKAEGFRPLVKKLLVEDATMLSVEILRRPTLDGYGGAKSALYALVKSERPNKPRPTMRFEGLPGEFCQHDFGQVDVRFLDGTKKRVHFFASRLKYSRWVDVSLVEDEAVESLVRALVDHYDRMGGVPLLAVFDRPKTVALAWRKDGVVSEWNPTFAGVALDLGLGVELCWPYSPQQKGAVENLVGWVKGSFFKQRRFLDQEDLRRQLCEWLDEVNTQRPSRATGVIPAERVVEERMRMRPLKVTPAELALRVPIVIGPTGYVVYDARSYSMPPGAIGLSGTLYLYRDRVRIVASRYDAEHDRLPQPHTKSTLAEHRAQLVAAVSGKRGRRYLQREHLLQLGGAALEYLTELVHRRPRRWTVEVERLHELLQVHGPEIMRSAFERALRAETFGAAYVAHYLGDPEGVAPAPRQQELPL
jgi:transposase